MRGPLVALVLIASLGCRRTPPEAPVGGEDSVVEPVRPLLVGPGVWADPSLLPIRVEVPAGWEIWPGSDPGEIARLLRRRGVEIRIHASDRNEPRPLPDCAWISHDRVGRHRDVPPLTPASLATCAPLEPDGDAVFSWIGRLGSGFAHVEVHLGPGELVVGRDEALAVLAMMTAISAGDEG